MSVAFRSKLVMSLILVCTNSRTLWRNMPEGLVLLYLKISLGKDFCLRCCFAAVVGGNFLQHRPGRLFSRLDKNLSAHFAQSVVHISAVIIAVPNAGKGVGAGTPLALPIIIGGISRIATFGEVPFIWEALDMVDIIPGFFLVLFRGSFSRPVRSFCSCPIG